MPFLVVLSINVAFLPAVDVPRLPEKLEPYPVAARGSLYFVNYLRNGTIGRMTADGGLSVWRDLPAPAFAFGQKAAPR